MHDEYSWEDQGHDMWSVSRTSSVCSGGVAMTNKTVDDVVSMEIEFLRNDGQNVFI